MPCRGSSAPNTTPDWPVWCLATTSSMVSGCTFLVRTRWSGILRLAKTMPTANHDTLCDIQARHARAATNRFVNMSYIVHSAYLVHNHSRRAFFWGGRLLGTGRIDEAGKGRGTTGTCGGNLLHADTSPSSRGRSLCRGFAHAECAKANLRLVSHTTSCAIGTDPHTVGPAGPGSWQRLPPRGRQAAAFKISNSERACTSLLAGFPESESAHHPRATQAIGCAQTQTNTEADDKPHGGCQRAEAGAA
jgi:hypothetical protein